MSRTIGSLHWISALTFIIIYLESFGEIDPITYFIVRLIELCYPTILTLQSNIILHQRSLQTLNRIETDISKGDRGESRCCFIAFISIEGRVNIHCAEADYREEKEQGDEGPYEISICHHSEAELLQWVLIDLTLVELHTSHLLFY